MRGSQPIKITSFTLIGVGVILLALTIYSRGEINLALPLVFLVLGGAFLIVIFSLQPKWTWADYLFIPADLLIAFGVIFLLNEITGDWNAWAYAWLLLVTGIGVALLLINRRRSNSSVVNLIGWSLTLGGVTLFAVFGVIAGGLFIQIIAPILLVIAGFSLRWLHFESILPESLVLKLKIQTTRGENPAAGESGMGALEEPLSSRELEVLQLIGAGLSNQQIAEKLSVAPSTVKTHINNLYGKLGVQTRVQAVNRARELNLLGSAE